MKKFVSMLLVLTMVLALASTAMAAVKFLPGDMVILKDDATAYTAAKSSKSTKNVAAAGSVALVVKECGDYVKVCVNLVAGTTVYFKKCDCSLYYGDSPVLVVWAKGGKGMSTCIKSSITPYKPYMTKVKVTGHTNLRKNPGMKFKSQGVVEKGDVLKYKGYIGIDDRMLVPWFKVRYKGKNLWISHAYCTEPYCAK